MSSRFGRKKRWFTHSNFIFDISSGCIFVFCFFFLWSLYNIFKFDIFFVLTSFHLVLVCSSRISRRNSFQNVYVSKPKLMSNHFQNTQTSVIFPFWVVLFPRLNANIGESLELFEASNCINSRCSFSYHSSVGLKLRFRCYWKICNR